MFQNRSSLSTEEGETSNGETNPSVESPPEKYPKNSRNEAF